MRLLRSQLWISLALALGIGGLGCSNDASPPQATGSLEVSLELGSSIEINEVRWHIFGGDMEMHGSIDTSAPGATASVEVFGIPPGEDYLVELEAVDDGGEIPCRGSAGFSVQAGRATDVMVMLKCKPPERFGGVRVNGELNVCAELDKVVVSPLRTSIGSEIQLSVAAHDAEGDQVFYNWLATGGIIANPIAPSTTYTCTRAGTWRIRVLAFDAPYPCIDEWSVEVTCVESDPSHQMCLPSDRMCSDAAILPAAACCDLNVPEQQTACAGDESLESPASCTPTGNTVTHTLTAMSLAPSCDIGYDLDDCEGTSCDNGGLAPGEGVDGVDNALTGLGPILSGVGGDLGPLNQAFADALCGVTASPQGQACAVPVAPLELRFVVDTNADEGCANVQITNGIETSTAILNVGQPTETGTFCASGALGAIPINILGVSGVLGNSAVRMTMSDAGFSDGVLGATLDRDTAVGLGELVLPGLGAVIGQVLDINDDLTQDTNNACNAMSAAFLVGGTTGAVVMPSNPVVPYDRRDVATIAPFPDDYWIFEDPTTETGYRVIVPTPRREPDVRFLYAALKAETLQLDGFSPIGGIVIPLAARPDTASLPLTPDASLEPSTALALLDLTPGSETYAERVPFHLSPVSRALGAQPIDHSLVLYPSVPLNPRGRYAMVLTRDALTHDGLPLEPSPFMTAVLEPEQPGEDPEITRARGLLADGVLEALNNDVSPPIERDDIALLLRISMRSTDDIPLTPLSMKEQVLARPAPNFTIHSIDPYFGDIAAVVRGTWEAPDWREDQYFISRDTNDDPQITGTLQVPFVLALPVAAESGPVPVVMLQHGSPGSSEQVVWEAQGGLAAAGFAVIGFTDTLNREIGQDLDYQNTVLFETLIAEQRFPHFAMQMYADMMSFLRVLERFDSVDVVPFPSGDGVPDLDLDAPLGYEGLSMGSVHGSAFLTYAPEIKAAAISAGAQRQAQQYFGEGSFVDAFPPNLRALLPNARPTDYWVGLTLFQMVYDHQDPHSHAAFLYRNRFEVAGTTRKPSVLLQEGVRDPTIPSASTRSLAWTFGPIPHLEPVWEHSTILESTTGPVTANIDSETTSAFYQFVPAGVPGIPHTPGCEFEPNGHFCAQGAEEARLQRRMFLRSAVENAVPTIMDPLSVSP